MKLSYTGQMPQVVRRSLLVREVWDSNPERVKSPTRCQQLTTVGSWRKAAEMGTAHSRHK